MSTLQAYLADGLIVVGLLIMSLAVYGMLWMPDIYTKLHAASKGAYLGVMSILAAVMIVWGELFAFKTILVVAVLLLTTPISAHAIGSAAFLNRYPMRVGKDQPDTRPQRHSQQPDNPEEIN